MMGPSPSRALDPERPRPRADELAEELAELELVRNREVERRLATARRIEAEAASLEARSLVMRARLAQGDALQRLGQVAEGAKLVLEVHRWATEHGPRSLEARSHLIMSFTFGTLGDKTAGLEHAVRGLELLDPDVSPQLRGHYLLNLADMLGYTGDFDQARRRYHQAADIFDALGDDDSYLRALNNLAYTEYEADRPDALLEAAMQIQLEAKRRGARLGPTSLDTIARAYMEHGRLVEAEAALSEAIADIEEGFEPQPDIFAEVLLSLSEVHRAMGKLDAALALVRRAGQIADELQLGSVAVNVKREEAEIHAAAGRWREAYEAHVGFHQATMAQQQANREAAAKTRQAMFEADEARQAAQRFWEQARRDSLTGLWNRRFVDEQLPPLLERAVTHQETLAIAFFDLDHFKNINDHRSHEAGDRVLGVVGELLGQVVVDTAGPGAFVARMGGEEFLLALPGTEPERATEILEAVRRTVAEHDWFGLTAGLPVTASVGATTARIGDTQGTALARADDRLYAAKRAGRNCVVADFAV